MKSFLSVTAAAFILSSATTAAVIKTPSVCKPGTLTVVNSTEINGKPFTHATCDPVAPITTKARDLGTSLNKRQGFNLCGAPCTTYCNSGVGGPNPNDCSAIANNLQGDGTFVVYTGSVQVWAYSSCEIYMINTYGQDEVYCYDSNNWAGVVNYVAWNCQATTGGYNGGSCHFYDNTNIGWVQVETYDI